MDAKPLSRLRLRVILGCYLQTYVCVTPRFCIVKFFFPIRESAVDHKLCRVNYLRGRFRTFYYVKIQLVIVALSDLSGSDLSEVASFPHVLGYFHDLIPPSHAEDASFAVDRIAGKLDLEPPRT